MSKQNTTPERIRELLAYTPETGFLTWRVAHTERTKVGERAGYLGAAGYRYVRIDGVQYREHRLVWLHTYARWPADQLDHINGVRDDNRLVNLRECNHSENHQNRVPHKNNTSGFLGVRWDKTGKKWRASIRVNGRSLHLGCFGGIEDAAAAYLAAKAKFHTFNPEVRA